MNFVEEILPCSMWVQVLFFPSELFTIHFSVLLTYSSQTGNETIHPYFLLYELFNLQSNGQCCTRLAACVSVLDRASTPHHCPLFFISFFSGLHTPSLPPCRLSFYVVSALTTLFLCSLSPSLPHAFFLPLCASILFLIAPFIKEYKYFSLFVAFLDACSFSFVSFLEASHLSVLLCFSPLVWYSCIPSAFYRFAISIIPGHPRICRKGF